MPSPFPGMDPYLEKPDLWPDVHNSLIIALRNYLAPKLRPKYYLAVEERLYLAEIEPPALLGRADVALVSSPAMIPPGEFASSATVPIQPVAVELPMPDQIRETYLEVRQASDKVITVIEILSPTNKRPDAGRNLYLQKRLNLIGTATHLVEIDLLRTWEPMPMWGTTPPTHYRILVSRSERRPMADLLPFNLQSLIPSFALPLLAGDEEPSLDLGPLLQDLYDQAGYDLRIDYNSRPEPPLSAADELWAETLLKLTR